MKTMSNSAGCSVFLAMFALPFAATGLFTSGLIFYTVFNWNSVRDWQETPAVVLKVHVKGSSDSDSTQTNATYEYEWDGQTYTGDRVSLHSGSDNIGSFQQRVAEELTRHHKSGEPFRCFVDPDDPSQSILYRELRWEMLAFLSVFGTIFGTVGMGLFSAAVMSIPGSRREAELRERHLNEPWLHKPEWAEGYVQADTSWRGWLTPLSMYWMAVTLPGGLGAFNDLTNGNGWGLFGLIMPGLSLLMVRGAYKARRRRRVYGESRVALDRFPAITGGVMTGNLLIEHDVDPLAVWQFNLTCVKTIGSGEDQETDTICELAHSTSETERSEDWGRSAVPFEFTIPFSARQTETDGNVQVEWKLEVHSERTATAFKEEFAIPVFRTEESSDDFKDEQQLARQRSHDEKRLDDLQPDGPLMQARLKVREQPDGTMTIIAPAARYKGLLLSFGIFILVWDSACAGMWCADDIPIAFPIIFSLLGALVTWAWLDLLLRSSHLEIEHDAITFRSGWPGLGRTHRVPLDEIQDVNVTSNMSVNQTQFPNVTVELKSGKKLTIISQIRGRPAAERVMERILEALTR